jgi:hypothetical protein
MRAFHVLAPDIVELETLSFTEIQSALPDSRVETAIVRGGFPELYANPDIDSAVFTIHISPSISNAMCAP